ncbi:hypothetical protein [Synechococcus phage S-H38]|uniref:Uncharacterized protein n=1 Tax=Synechococcus phage S-H38 TaxID=2783673 RepID=A0A873W9Z1_9CAUD|nr:hypothetical protein PQC14_gp074 [Synechococcus phage S-H38]QPB07987.1 hypothetical protein [Synechococcus phage S-H38]
MSGQVFDAIFAKDNAATLDYATDVLQQKALEMIQQRKSEMAQQLFFSQPEQEVEQPEEESEE